MTAERIRARLVLDTRVATGTVALEDGWIAAVELEAGAENTTGDELPILAPGFVDVHVHGWGGHAATGDATALSGMARALLRQGVTSFLPTAPTLAGDELPRFADRVRRWIPDAPADGAEPLGFNLEGPFLAPSRKGAHDPALLVAPDAFPPTDLEPLLDGLRVITVAPELPGALPLIESLAARGVAVSLGHSDATVEQARAGYGAGARSTTHLFNAMSGLDHRAPGLAAAALTEDDAWVELIADGNHVDLSLWPIVARTKPRDRVLLVSDALPSAGMGDGRTMIGGLPVEVRGGRAVLAGTSTLAGCVIALDTALRNVVANGSSLPDAVLASSTNPLALLGQSDRGRIAPGQRAHLVELDRYLRVRRVTRGDGWVEGAG